jgi:hypothetical protein
MLLSVQYEFHQLAEIKIYLGHALAITEIIRDPPDGAEISSCTSISFMNWSWMDFLFLRKVPS